MLDQTLKKAEKAARAIDREKNNFTNSVVPLVDKLEGLNGVAEDLLREAMNKTTLVRQFEESLAGTIFKFKAKQGKAISMKL